MSIVAARRVTKEGHPGMGKTTFLRKVGLEALKQAQGEYRPVAEPVVASPPQQQGWLANLQSLSAATSVYIPVFLELRQFRWDKSEKIDLEVKIAEEFQNCGLPDASNATKKFLEHGRLLIILDGLDEVPTEQLGQMTIAIKNLVDRYDKNRFIVSCRIAAYRNFDNFSRFTDVAISEFDEMQVKHFITNWFKSHDWQELGHECWGNLNSADRKATKELTKTPLLLTLICILFLRRGEFPRDRLTLYEESVKILLREWDWSKNVKRDQLYRGLDLKRKELMLGDIAYLNFIDDNLFFRGQEIAQQIESSLSEMIDEERIDGRDVLRAVEEHHGVLVSRDENRYSFSHLTLQEFFTAKHKSLMSTKR